MSEPNKLPEHGIKAAFYSNGPDGYRPTLECSCGEAFREGDWESAGAEFDRHLRGTAHEQRT